MADTIFIKPKSGRAIISPDHNNQPLPISGAFVAKTTYWQRRINDGDVEITTPPKPTKQTGEN